MDKDTKPLPLPAIIAWLSLQLTKQKRTDFKPRNDDLSFARVNTEPCVACCESLEKVRDAAKESLSGKNLEGFLTEIGVAFHRWVVSCYALCRIYYISLNITLTPTLVPSLLLDHLKKFPVSATGGLMLAKLVPCHMLRL